MGRTSRRNYLCIPPPRRRCQWRSRLWRRAVRHPSRPRPRPCHGHAAAPGPSPARGRSAPSHSSRVAGGQKAVAAHGAGLLTGAQAVQCVCTGHGPWPAPVGQRALWVRACYNSGAGVSSVTHRGVREEEICASSTKGGRPDRTTPTLQRSARAHCVAWQATTSICAAKVPVLWMCWCHSRRTSRSAGGKGEEGA